MPHFCPSFCSLCPQNQDPESLGTGVSPRWVHIIGKPFPDPMNCLLSTNPDPFVSPYPPWIYSENVCVTLQEKTGIWRVENPHRRPESRTMPIQASSSLSLCKDLSLHTLPQWVKWLKHSQKGGSHFSCNTWKHSFFNTAVHPHLAEHQNIGLQKISWNHLHHSLLKQGKHYLDTKGISPDCSIVLSLTTKHLAAFLSLYVFFHMKPNLISHRWNHWL